MKVKLLAFGLSSSLLSHACVWLLIWRLRTLRCHVWLTSHEGVDSLLVHRWHCILNGDVARFIVSTHDRLNYIWNPEQSLVIKSWCGNIGILGGPKLHFLLQFRVHFYVCDRLTWWRDLTTCSFSLYRCWLRSDSCRVLLAPGLHLRLLVMFGWRLWSVRRICVYLAIFLGNDVQFLGRNRAKCFVLLVSTDTTWLTICINV